VDGALGKMPSVGRWVGRWVSRWVVRVGGVNVGKADEWAAV
jgi:hypothetical protein